ncbi:MAG TPA: histidinol-phosphate transaminase, partial [Acidimicrobiaceae bacterium]|nr:histidinol-phosphate transaminase [Acidimicrobiaceae bacterium]
EDLDRVALPYHLDSLKQKIGVIALRHAGAMAERVSILIAERKRLLAGLARLPVTTWPSEANFVLFRTESRPSSEVWQALLDRSVLVRDFTDL